MRTLLTAATALLLILVPLYASAAYVSISPGGAHSIALVGTTDITFSVNPDGMSLRSFVLDFSVVPSEIELVDVGAGSCWVSASFATSCDPVTGQFGVVGSFATDQTTPFTLGTVRLQGLVPEALLYGPGGHWTDGDSVEWQIRSWGGLASVVPEPGTLTLLALGMLPLAASGRRRRNG
jgi:hypothetical protein